MRFGMIVREDPHSASFAKQVEKSCSSIGWTFATTNLDILLSIGGDGTLLRGIHQYIDQLDSMSVVGIHTGTLGFYTDYTQDELQQFLYDVQDHEPQYEEMPLLEFRQEHSIETYYALNEVRIESVVKTLSLDVYIDGEYFEHCTGSGICISTQAGSTAINRALQGAVIDDGLRVLQMCEIMPITHKNHHSLRNPYILRLDRKIKVEGSNLSKAKLCFDHLDAPLLDEPIYIHTSDKKVRFARYRQYSYLKRLKNLY